MSDPDDLPYVVVERRSGGFGTFMLGALLGAGVALLMAPRSGREMREGFTTGVRRIRETAEGAVRGVQDSITGVREQVTGRVEAARDAFEAGRDAARESRAEMERRIREARSGFDAGVRAARRGRTPTRPVESELEEGDDVVL